MKETVNLQFRVEPEFAAEMERQAKFLGMSRTELLRLLVYGNKRDLEKMVHEYEPK